MEVTRYPWSAVRTVAEKQPSVYTSLVRSGLLVDGKLVLIEDVSNDHGKRRLVLGNGRVVGVSSEILISAEIIPSAAFEKVFEESRIEVQKRRSCADEKHIGSAPESVLEEVLSLLDACIY